MERVRSTRRRGQARERDVVGADGPITRGWWSGRGEYALQRINTHFQFCQTKILNVSGAGSPEAIEWLGMVDENYRGQGIGKKLISRIEEIAIGNQCKQIELDSAFHRKEAHHFYENIGFKSRAYLFTKPLVKIP